MSVPHHRSSVLASRQLVAAGPTLESNHAMEDQLWAVDKAYKRSTKEADILSTRISNVPSKGEPKTHLRINTYSRPSFHDRYLSSEEEPSPSPDSDTESNEEELERKAPEQMVRKTVSLVTPDEYDAEIAIAVPIIPMRPKLVDVTNFAPTYKRKRAEKLIHSRSAVKNAGHCVSTATDRTKPVGALEVTKVATPEERLPKHSDGLYSLATESWLPVEGVHIVQGGEAEDEHYFPDLDIRKAPTYDDYDPYSLSPPRLSPRNSYHTASKKPGSVTRARYNSNPPITMNSGWKGLTRSISLAKRQALHRVDHQVSKKPKMIARAANERQEPLKIPAFPFGDSIDVE